MVFKVWEVQEPPNLAKTCIFDGTNFQLRSRPGSPNGEGQRWLVGPFDDFDLQNPFFEKSRSRLTDVLGIHGGGGSTGMLNGLWMTDSHIRNLSKAPWWNNLENILIFGSTLMGGQFLLTCLMPLACKNDFWKPKQSEFHVFLAKQRPLLAPSWKVSMENSLGLAGNLNKNRFGCKNVRKTSKNWKSGVQHFWL